MSLEGGVFELVERRAAASRLHARFRLPPPEHAVFDGHFAGDPLLPAWIQLALTRDLLETWLPRRRASSLARARFRAPARPGCILTVELALASGSNAASFKAWADDVLCATGHWELSGDEA